MDWYIRWIAIPIAAATLLGLAWGLFLVFWPLGLIAFFFAALLIERLLHCHSEQSRVRDRTEPLK